MKTFSRFILALMIPILFLSLLSVNLLSAKADTVISWGVNPNTHEATPTPPAGSEKMLKENNGIFVAPTDQKKVYFTFDLGYEAGHTAKVLDTLKEHNIKAIFFLCGNYLKENELIERMISEGHSIGNHTEKHKDLPTLSDEAAKADITTFQENFKAKYSGQEMRFFRPPQGRFSERILKLTANEGLKTVLWSIAIVDWGKDAIPSTVNAKKITSRLHAGAIILMHITNSGTPKMVEELIPLISQKGYTIGNPSEL